MLLGELLEALAAGGGEQGAHRALFGTQQKEGAREGRQIVEVDTRAAEVSRQFTPPALGGEEELRQGALQGPQQSADAVRSRALARARRPAILEGGEGCAAARSGDREGPAAAASLREQPARRRVMRLLAGTLRVEAVAAFQAERLVRPAAAPREEPVDERHATGDHSHTAEHDERDDPIVRQP